MAIKKNDVAKSDSRVKRDRPLEVPRSPQEPPRSLSFVPKPTHPCPTKNRNPPAPIRLKVTDINSQNGTFNSSTIGLGVEQMHTHGFCIIENCIPLSIIESLYKTMHANAITKASDPKTIYNHGGPVPTNFGMSPPLDAKSFHQELYANSYAMPIIQGMLGPRPKLGFLSSNVEMPAPKPERDSNSKGSRKGKAPVIRQAVHSDSYGNHPLFCYAIEVYIFLHSVSPENGSTETWPGTHIYPPSSHDSSGRSYISPQAFKSRARVRPPIQPIIPAGSLCMRDLRLWHAGMPNLCEGPRIMLALIYFPGWWDLQMRIALPKEMRDVITKEKEKGWEAVDFEGCTEWKERGGDGVALGSKGVVINFSQEKEGTQKAWRDMIDKKNGVEKGKVYVVTEKHYWTEPQYSLRSKKPGNEGDEEA